MNSHISHIQHLAESVASHGARLSRALARQSVLGESGMPPAELTARDAAWTALQRTYAQLSEQLTPPGPEAA